MNSVPNSSWPLVRVDNHYRHALLDFVNGVVGIGQTQTRASHCDWLGDLLIARKMRAFRFTPRKKSLASSSPHAANRQAACVAVVPNSGLAIPHRSSHCGSRRSRIDFGLRSSANLIGVDDQYPGPGGESVPQAFRRTRRLLESLRRRRHDKAATIPHSPIETY